MPLGPPGIWVLAHEKPNQHGTWSAHGTEGGYISLAMDHYCCYTIVVNKTIATQIMDTLEFFPCNYKMPATSSADLAIQAAKDLIYALHHPHQAGSYSSIGDAQLCALDTLVDISNSTLLVVGVKEMKPTHAKAVPRLCHPMPEPIAMWM